jgi:hypothetical protein
MARMQVCTVHACVRSRAFMHLCTCRLPGGPLPRWICGDGGDGLAYGSCAGLRPREHPQSGGLRVRRGVCSSASGDDPSDGDGDGDGDAGENGDDHQSLWMAG